MTDVELVKRAKIERRVEVLFRTRLTKEYQRVSGKNPLVDYADAVSLASEIAWEIAKKDVMTRSLIPTVALAVVVVDPVLYPFQGGHDRKAAEFEIASEEPRVLQVTDCARARLLLRRDTSCIPVSAVGLRCLAIACVAAADAMNRGETIK